MPNITVDGPRIDDMDKKREMVRTITDAAVKAYGLPKQSIVVLIKENKPENDAVAGELLTDRSP